MTVLLFSVGLFECFKLLFYSCIFGIWCHCNDLKVTRFYRGGLDWTILTFLAILKEVAVCMNNIF